MYFSCVLFICCCSFFADFLLTLICLIQMLLNIPAIKMVSLVVKWIFGMTCEQRYFSIVSYELICEFMANAWLSFLHTKQFTTTLYTHQSIAIDSPFLVFFFFFDKSTTINQILYPIFGKVSATINKYYRIVFLFERTI